eukprot:scaffold36212_cov46-Phaeocystis_antarctica.AAC.1
MPPSWSTRTLSTRATTHARERVPRVPSGASSTASRTRTRPCSRASTCRRSDHCTLCTPRRLQQYLPSPNSIGLRALRCARYLRYLTWFNPGPSPGNGGQLELAGCISGWLHFPFHPR